VARVISPHAAGDRSRFCYGWTLWLFLSWIPSFFYQNYQQNLMQSAFYSAGVFLAGVIGDTFGRRGERQDPAPYGRPHCRAAQRHRGRHARRFSVSDSSDAGSRCQCCCDLTRRRILCVELVVAPIWAVPMDSAPRYSGSASGMMTFGFGTAGIISPFVFGYLIDRTGSWTLPFCRLNLPFVAWRRARVSHASRPAIRGGA
jgi:MFS family permease